MVIPSTRQTTGSLTTHIGQLRTDASSAHVGLNKTGASTYPTLKEVQDLI